MCGARRARRWSRVVPIATRGTYTYVIAFGNARNIVCATVTRRLASATILVRATMSLGHPCLSIVTSPARYSLVNMFRCLAIGRRCGLLVPRALGTGSLDSDNIIISMSMRDFSDRVATTTVQ